MTSKQVTRIALSAGLLFLCAASASLAQAAAPRGNLRYSVIVEKFKNESHSHYQLGDEWATQLTSALHESGHFIVVAQDDMQLRAVKEQVKGASGVQAQGKKTAVRGQMTPAQLLVKGVITNFKQDAAKQDSDIKVGGIGIQAGRRKTEIRATLQMIDASTGALVAAKDFTGTAQERGIGIKINRDGNSGGVKSSQDDDVHKALADAIREVIPWMVAQLPSVAWRGTVVKVTGDRVIINRGSREGVSTGLELIAGESEPIRDPDTGELLDEIVTERARLRVVTVNERTSVCSVVSGDPSLIIEGMGIQLGS